ncbi:MAG: DUF4255 domain-containing protein, partial [Anaerolineae bacterium]|nr:DUF4255 domain-containing protein [Anaerolineae bacterium]
MSNFLAIATATETLRQMLDAVVQVDVPGAEATAVRPAGGGNGLPTTGVNVFMFQATPNASLRNLDLPTRDSDGRLVQRPRAALDLHYLLSCYGLESQLEPQRILGSVVSQLQSQPVLTPTRIRQVIDDAVASDPQSYLATSNLDQEIESVKFSMMPLTLDELARMWSVFFQTEYALSVVYVGTAVLIERQETPRSGLPVRARNVYAMPFRQPVIEQVTATDGEPITITSTLQIEGKRLQGDITRLRFTDLDGDVTPASVSDGTITTPVPAALRAGVVGVQVVQLLQLGTPATEHRGFESNVFAFVLRPTLNSITPGVLTGTLVDGVTRVAGTLTLTF